MSQDSYNKLINYFGSQTKTAEALNCSQPSVWKWAKGMGFMSLKFAKKAEKVTEGKFKAIDLCPALSEELEETN